MVKRIIWPFNLGDFLRDAKRLSVTEKGAYFLLLADYWSHGSLPAYDRDIQRIAEVHDNRTWARIKPRLQVFFHDGWKHTRMEIDLKKSAEFSARQSANAVSGNRKRAHVREHASGDTYLDGGNPNKNNGRRAPGRPPDERFPSSLREEDKSSSLGATAGSLATALPTGALARQPFRQRTNKFRVAWEKKLADELGDKFPTAMKYLAGDQALIDRCTSAEIREPGAGGALAAMIDLRQAKKNGSWP